MRYSVSMPNFADYGDLHTLVELAREAEAAGWDGFFLWDHMIFWRDLPMPIVDPWVALAAIAVGTERISVGPMVTPVARRRPWKLARETVSLDHLSGGRLILGVGLGDPADADFGVFGEATDAKVRARKLDEGLDVLAGLWSGEPFSYQGEHYRVEETVFLPRPVQSPRIPVWVGGWWPHKPPLRRAARWDGVVPGKMAPDGTFETLTPDDLRAILAYIAGHRMSDGPFDVAIAGETPGDDPAGGAAIVAPYAEAGATWWIENIHGYRGPFGEMRARIRLGPPRG
jgi:alkanesulfonate monooxygenase SsuD/methylene tetrahydromethanopterin reductase-like flavin-dependent oxidoreductase (luciferase family)